MWIKVILVIAIALVAVVAMRGPRGARTLALRRIALAFFALLAAFTVIFPDIWTAVADALGVGRGTDLLLYLFIVVVLAYMASTYLRFREVETQLTLLARRIALDEVGASPVAGQDLPVPGPEFRPAGDEDVVSPAPTGSVQVPQVPTTNAAST